MQIPGIYPEPNNVVISAGFTCMGSDTGIYVEEAAADILPELPDMAKACFHAAVRTTDEGIADISVRMLTQEDISFAGDFFKRKYEPEDIENDVFFLNISDKKTVISALTREGFFYALQTLGRLVSRNDGSRAPKLRKGVIFDYARMKTRAVSIKSPDAVKVSDICRLLPVMADLRYNTLIIEDPNAELSAGSVLNELRDACGSHFIKLCLCRAEDMRLICGLDGSSFLDWEHRSARRFTDGAAISYTCGPDTGDPAESGFLFNLAYSAYMLWNLDYDNFSWEKVNDLAADRMPALMEILAGRRIRAEMDEIRDTYRLPFIYDKERHLARLEPAVTPGETAILSKAGEKADALIFRHSIEDGAPANGDNARIIGHYTVYYKDGTCCEIPLRENRNIGRSDIRTGRSYNAWKHAYDTGKALGVLSCYTSLVKRVSADGKLKVLFDYSWENPYPDKVIGEISLAVYPSDADYSVVVYEINMENNLMNGRVEA